MGDISPDKKSGCGLLNAVFGRRSFWPRRSTSPGSLSAMAENNLGKMTPSSTPKRRRSGSDEVVFLDNKSSVCDGTTKPITKAPVHPNIPPMQHQNHHYAQQQQQIQAQRMQVSEQCYNQYQAQSNQNQYQVQGHQNHFKKVPKEAVSISGELESMIADHQKSKGSSTFVRASSSNVMLFGNLGNLRQPGGNNINSYAVFDSLPKTAREENSVIANGKYPNSVMGNVVKKPPPKQQEEKTSAEQPSSLCRALSTRMDPEQLKIMGNEDYKNGNFAEALALYDAAISIDPNKASYRSNKSAALTALGRLLEAVFECREAIRIEPQYHRAHHRLANLYLRLGEAEKAMYHYKHSGPEADHVDIAKAKGLQVHINKCTEVKKIRDWNSLVKETAAAISDGADSAPQIFSLQAEALVKLHRHEEANEALKKGPHFDVDECTKLFGPIGNASILMVRAQVDMAAGRLLRFDDAFAAALRATRLDPNNKEANTVMRKARGVAAARSNGNQLFKAGKYYEASTAYGEGLEDDAYNSVLLCNRAACRSKLGQYEKAVEDCTAALNVRPGYIKARLRRADCYAKMTKWEASIQDYEILQNETPDDEEVRVGLLEAKTQLKKLRGDDK